MRKHVFLLGALFLILSNSLKSSELPSVVSDYLSFQESLTQDKMISLEDLTQYKKNTLLLENKELTDSVEKMKEAKSIEEQREAFKVLSNQVIQIAEKENVSGVYRAQCHKAEAKWLQKEKTVMNPYFGKSQLHCGKSEAL